MRHLPFPVRSTTRLKLAPAVLAAWLVGVSCSTQPVADPEPGVSLELATRRSAIVSDLRYELRFYIPEERSDTVRGEATIRFTLSDASDPLVLDFRGDSTSVRNVKVNGNDLVPRTPNGHVVIPASLLESGANTVSMSFSSSDEALNRNDEFLYALFVPDRASTAFPSFDQPDLKARYSLVLDIPRSWRAIANGPETGADTAGDRISVAYGETEPISTYLVSFAAGVFEVEEAERAGRTLTMFHRESDSTKVARNRDAIFDLHATALEWLEEYTQIRYPFGKFAFLAVPSFQFGGMEHPGAVWYRASSLFLDESATQNQYLGRASLIAHETAHMWFGDLVTMRWFNDVWTKEVFANFMAAKIVEPSFPEVNHDLRFALSYHPAAYGVDRTAGANPIRQDLENLRQAGSLYGAIIYQKAPIVMRQLEELVGETTFREGMRTYLDRYRFANASWPDLIGILDSLSPLDLSAWSRAWVEEPGRPVISANLSAGTLTLRQHDADTLRNLRWKQSIGVALGYPDTIVELKASLDGDSTTVALPGANTPMWILPGTDGVSYAHFQLDSSSAKALTAVLPSLGNPIHRAAALSALRERVLSGEMSADSFLDLCMRALASERDELLTQQLLGFTRSTYWRFLSDSARIAFAPLLESVLWSGLGRAEGTSRKGAYWSAIGAVTLTDSGLARLRKIWETRQAPRGLPLSVQQYTALAENLALHKVPNVEAMLDSQFTRITNPDQKERFAFVRPSLSANRAVRDSVFASFNNVENRRRESWVLDAVRNLNHPVHARESEHYIAPGLALVEEIQRTGDIFFPLGWMNALLDGHQSVSAANSVVRFLDNTPELQPRLRGKLLQAADDLFRSARIVHNWSGAPVMNAAPE